MFDDASCKEEEDIEYLRKEGRAEEDRNAVVVIRGDRDARVSAMAFMNMLIVAANKVDRGQGRYVAV